MDFKQPETFDIEESKLTDTGFVANMRGKYYWMELYDLDNTTGGELQEVVETTVKIVVDKKQVIDSIKSSKTSLGTKVTAEAKAGGVFKLIDLSASTTTEMNQHLEYYNELKMSSEENYHREETTVKKRTVTISKGDIFKLYQLCFTGPGVSIRFDTLSSEPKPLDEVIVQATYEEKVYNPKEVLEVLGDTVPGRDNKVEWKRIRDNIAT